MSNKFVFDHSMDRFDNKDGGGDFASQVLLTQNYTALFDTAIGAAVNEGSISLSDFEKLDFSFPVRAAEHTPESRYRVFDSANGLKLAPPPQEWIDSLSRRKAVVPVFNLRRYADAKGRTVDRLILIIPHATCNGIVSNSSSPEVPIDNHQLVEDGVRFDGCVPALDKNDYFYFITLSTRYKTSKDGPWHR